MKSNQRSVKAQELPDLSPVAFSQGEDIILICSTCAPLVGGDVLSSNIVTHPISTKGGVTRFTWHKLCAKLQIILP